MVSRLPYFLRLVLFWFILFTSFRLLFIAFNPSEVIQAPFPVVLQSLVAGFRLDLSTVAYVMLPTFVCWVLYQITRRAMINTIHFWVLGFILFSLCLLYVGTIKMYHEWSALITYAIFDYLVDPGEVISFVPYMQLIGMVVFLVLYVGAGIWLYKKLIPRFELLNENIWKKAGISLCIPVLLFLLARGGIQLAPINESSAYYTDNPFFNHVAVNPYWYFIHSYLERDPSSNPYLFLDSKDAEDRNAKLFSVSDTTDVEILNVKKPNVVMIVLESWTADIIASLGGEEGITPNFDSLRKEGLLMTQIYNSGSRTEHGLVSVLSGYPPPPRISIITKPNKSQKLNNLNTVLAADGYASSFYYGGEIGFVNMKSFLLDAHFQKITDRNDFSKAQCNSKWGAHDEFVLSRQLEDLKSSTEPFFSVLLTLSSHEPFDVPIATPYKGTDEPDLFRAAAYYSDQCLGNYFREAKKQPWYDHTLFILVADHGHRLPKNNDTNFPPTKHIPLLFLGGALKDEYKGTTNPIIGNQHDLVSTVLHQLHQDANGFDRSKDLLNPATHPFAYYVNNNVLGWITPEQTLVYVFTSKELIKVNANSDPIRDDSIFLDAKAYLQTHFQTYLDF